MSCIFDNSKVNYIYITTAGWRHRPLVRLKRRWVDNIKMDLREMGQSSLNWINLAQDRDQWRVLVNTAVNRPGP
jgi:hypothetical protein